MAAPGFLPLGVVNALHKTASATLVIISFGGLAFFGQRFYSFVEHKKQVLAAAAPAAPAPVAAAAPAAGSPPAAPAGGEMK